MFKYSKELLQNKPEDTMYAYCYKSYAKLIDGRTVPLGFGMCYVDYIYNHDLSRLGMHKVYSEIPN